MSYTTVAQTLINARDIREQSSVRIVGEHDEEIMYSKSVYDACLEASDADSDLFNIVFLMYTGNEERSFVWATRNLASS